MRISFVAPSGYGKSTAIKLLKPHYEMVNLRIAEPLYEMQRYFYQLIGVDLNGEQDGELLQFLGMKIRKESPDYLINEFCEKINQFQSLIITNDDCRPLDYYALKQLGFIFVKINSYSHDRLDHSKANQKHSNEWQTDIPYDYEIDNYTDIKSFEKNLILLMEEIKNEQMLHHPRTRTMSK